MKDEQIREIIVNHRPVFDGKIIHVEHMDVTLPNGKTALREVVRHMGASAVVPVDAEGNVTMVKQMRAAVDQILLEIPAGKLDGKGEDRLLAAQRELKEETGLEADNWVHLTDLLTTPGFCDEKISIYLATGLRQGDTCPDEDEFLSLQRMPLEEACAMVEAGTLCDSKTIAGLLLARAHLAGR